VKKRDWIFAVISCAMGALFLLLAVKAGKVDTGITLRELRDVAPTPLIALVLLTAVHISLSNQKWRCVDAVLRAPSDAVPSIGNSFGMTAIGVALGQLLPMHLGVITARTVGSHFLGRPFARGTIGSVFEQSFDVLIMGLLSLASFITLLSHGGSSTWIFAGSLMVTVALLAAACVMRWIHRLGSSVAGCRFFGWSIRRHLETLRNSGLLSPTLVRKLIVLSTARFAVQVLMAAQVGAAIGIHIQVWHLAASIPLVILACVIILTPGGIGISELGYAGILHLFGTPLNTGAQWAVASRILISGSCFTIAGFTVLFAGAIKLRPYSKRYEGRAADITCEP
jgi:uncharacterized membrane protein YbhN (UPF0104 family)